MIQINLEHDTIAPYNYLFLLRLLSCNFFRISGNLEQNILTDHQAANKIQLLVAIKGNFSGLSFSEQVAAKGENVATCFYVYQ